MVHFILAGLAVGSLARWPSRNASVLAVAAAASVSILLGAPVTPALTLIAPLIAFLGAALTLAALVGRSGLAERPCRSTARSC
jgi:hypothetical protein